MKKVEKIQRLLGCDVASRFSYAALSACHSAGCFLTEKPELYGPIALVYFFRAFAKHE
jgi:hypothetical protein